MVGEVHRTLCMEIEVVVCGRRGAQQGVWNLERWTPKLNF